MGVILTEKIARVYGWLAWGEGFSAPCQSNDDPCKSILFKNTSDV